MPYTIGPWHAVNSPKDGCFIVDPQGRNLLYALHEAPANANLMAAAPDLLSATRKLLHALTVLGYEPVDGDYRSIVEQAEDAIKKAEGRCCGATAPGRFATCDKPAGHSGDHWTYAGHTQTWSR